MQSYINRIHNVTCMNSVPNRSSTMYRFSCKTAHCPRPCFEVCCTYITWTRAQTHTSFSPPIEPSRLSDLTSGRQTVPPQIWMWFSGPLRLGGKPFLCLFCNLCPLCAVLPRALIRDSDLSTAPVKVNVVTNMHTWMHPLCQCELVTHTRMHAFSLSK